MLPGREKDHMSDGWQDQVLCDLRTMSRLGYRSHGPNPPMASNKGGQGPAQVVGPIDYGYGRCILGVIIWIKK